MGEQGSHLALPLGLHCPELRSSGKLCCAPCCPLSVSVCVSAHVHPPAEYAPLLGSQLCPRRGPPCPSTHRPRSKEPGPVSKPHPGHICSVPPRCSQLGSPRSEHRVQSWDSPSGMLPVASTSLTISSDLVQSGPASHPVPQSTGVPRRTPNTSANLISPQPFLIQKEGKQGRASVVARPDSYCPLHPST